MEFQIPQPMGTPGFWNFEFPTPWGPGALPTRYVVNALGNSDFCRKCFIWTQMASWYPTFHQVAVFFAIFGDFGDFMGVKQCFF